MAKDQTDHLGRTTGTVPSAKTVTGFAVEQGTLDADDAGVKATLAAERKREEAGTEHAQAVSDAMNAPSPTIGDLERQAEEERRQAREDSDRE